MEPAIKNQIERIRTELDEFIRNLKFSSHFFTANIIPELKVIKEEFDLISRLTRYEKSALIFTANEIEYKHKPTTYHNAKKISSSLLKHINISLLIVTLIFTVAILYHSYFRFSIYTLIGLWIAILFTVFLIIIKFLTAISEFKDKQCLYLVRQTIALKEKNMSDKELQLLFKSAGDLMTEARDQKIKDEKLISLLREALTQKEKNI